MAGAFDILEWPDTAPVYEANHDPVRCIAVGLGAASQGIRMEGSVVLVGERDAHQLFGIEGDH